MLKSLRQHRRRRSTASLSQPIPSPKWKRRRKLNLRLDLRQGLHLGRAASEHRKAAGAPEDAAVEVAVDAEGAAASKL